ncbi:protein LURP-one-related 4 [Castanea sativa]|uniref:protein LURP-one-related 4 n=1 Tax=Castanea sativa TaxID=21020 RepID=UPI003F64A4C4
MFLLMARIYPHILTGSPYMTSKGETFTIWMKSLLYHAYGCTVFNSKGEIVYRVDNYDSKCSNEVHLMDLRGKILFTIRRKKLQAFGCWNGYRWSGSSINKEKSWFQVKKYCRMLMRDVACRITVGYDKYWIVRFANKAAFRIVDVNGDVVAEAKRKYSSSGVVLGEDVLALEVVPHMDHSLIMAFVVVYGLIRRRM